MNTLLLAAGFGTRLRPITESIPKCLVPINGDPLLNIWLKSLNQISLKKIFLNTHYLSNQVHSYISSLNYDMDITIFHENILLGTAGTIINNIQSFLDEDLIVIHADNYCLTDLSLLIKAHRNRPSNCLMTMMTFHTSKPEDCGIVEVENNIVVKFHEKIKNPPGDLANCAVYVFSPELLNLINHKLNSIKDISIELIPQILGKIFNYTINDTFIDIGTIETYELANKKK